jgi:hypothetical protein
MSKFDNGHGNVSKLKELLFKNLWTNNFSKAKFSKIKNKIHFVILRFRKGSKTVFQNKIMNKFF